MGVRFAREYNAIITDLTMALREIDGFYELFEMKPEEWNQLGEQEQVECAKTFADDVFYGLGNEPTLQVGQGTVSYDRNKHVITVSDGAKCINIVYLT